MNNLFAECDFIWQSVLPPRRWKIRRIKKAYDKSLLRLYAEYSELNKIILNMEYEDLTFPIQNGYKRCFELVENAYSETDTMFFLDILQKINTIQYSQTKLFKKIRSKRLSKYKYRKRGNPILRDLTKKEFNLLNEKEKRYFYPMEIYYFNTKLWVTRYRFVEPWRFELRIRPNMLTKIQKHNFKAERRVVEIFESIIKNKLFVKVDKLKRKFRSHLRDARFNNLNYLERNPLRNKSIYEIMDFYNEEKEYDYK